MATFSNIAGAEPSTVTFRVATVELDRGGTVEDREILVIGDPDTTNAVAAVLAGAPASTAWGLVVRQQGYSTTVNVSSLAGPVIVRSSAADALVTVYQSSYGALLANVHNSTIGDLLASVQQNSTVWQVQAKIQDSSAVTLGGSTAAPGTGDQGLVVRQVGYSTTVNVSSLAGPVIVRSSAANALVSVYQSTAADLNVTVAGYSTTVNVSSLAGTVLVAPASSGATGFFAAQISDGSTFVSDSTNRAIRVNVVAGSAAGDTTVTVMPASSASTRWFPVQIGDGSTWISDSTNRAIRVNVVAGSAAGDTTVTVMPGSSGATGFYAVRLSDGSTFVSDSTERAIRVNVTTGSIAVTGYSTTVNVSSLAGAVITRSSAADALHTVYQSSYGALLANVHNSTIGDLLASVQQNSTVWQVQAKIQDSSAVGFIGTTTRPTTGAQGLVVRQVLNDLLSTCFSTIGNNSTSATVVSSAAGVKHKVYAYSITSTAQAINTLTFASSLGNPIWQVQMQSVSSGITGANLAVTPPAWLFATESASPLVFKIGSNTGSYHLSFSYFTEA